jgi:ribosomal protein L35
MFKYQKLGYRHLNRNKTRRNLSTKRKAFFLHNQADIKRAKKMMPYFRRRKALKY